MLYYDLIHKLAALTILDLCMNLARSTSLQVCVAEMGLPGQRGEGGSARVLSHNTSIPRTVHVQVCFNGRDKCTNTSIYSIPGSVTYVHLLNTRLSYILISFPAQYHDY